jgi:hypothetical protein
LEERAIQDQQNAKHVLLANTAMVANHVPLVDFVK